MGIKKLFIHMPFATSPSRLLKCSRLSMDHLMGPDGISYNAVFPTIGQFNVGPNLWVLRKFHVSIQTAVTATAPFRLSQVSCVQFFQPLFLKFSFIHFSGAYVKIYY